MAASTPDFGSAQKTRRKDKDTLVPVTIQMIHKAEQDTNEDSIFRMSGTEFSQVRVVGCIVEMKEQSTNIQYTIEDGTGRVECKMWLEEDDGDDMSQERAKCVEGAYVRVIGTVKVFNDKRNISAFNVRPVTDFNEITHHSLEAIYVNLKSSGKGSSAPTSSSASFAGAATKSFEGTNSAGGGMDSLQSDVLKVFTENSSNDNEGLDIKRAIEMLVPKGHSSSDIRKAIGFLTDEGHLYSTIDENHLKSTENC